MVQYYLFIILVNYKYHLYSITALVPMTFNRKHFFPRVLSYFQELPPLKRFGSSHCDDWVDRLSHVYTSLVLLAFTVVVSTVQMVGESIRCWIPAELNDGRESFDQYINSYCWIKNTYFIPFLESIPTDVQQRKVVINIHQC